jgi:YbbR domain-containing protein
MSVQIIRKNFGLKLLSLALAIVGWAYFRYAGNPVLAARFDQQLSVPIVTANLPVGYIARFADKEAVVTVAARRGEPAIKPDQIKAVLDLAGKEPGVYNIPVELVAPDVVVQSLSPASVSLTIEKIDEHLFPLAFHYTSADAGSLVVNTTSLEPQDVVVRGPSDELNEVTAVRVEVAVPAQPQAFDEMVRPIPVDAMGQEVTGLDVSPDLVRARVQFVRGTGTKK